MAPLIVHRGVAAPLLRANIDTDAIIPSREMRRVSRSGLAAGLFANWRYLNPELGPEHGRELDPERRVPDPDFVLNRPERAGASILLCGPNFGCGSSREHAVWALDEFGIRVVVAPDFSPIFRKNCVANGLLPAAAPLPAIRELARWSDVDPPGRLLTVDLRAREIRGGGAPVRFDIAPGQRMRLLRGLDDIALTRTRSARVDAFEERRFAEHPWVRPREGSGR